jgi:hypothetical protein
VAAAKGLRRGGLGDGDSNGETIETPTQQMPFKAIIKVDGKVVTEEFFPTRAASEEFILGAIQRPEELTRKGGKLR